jgi:glycosyltransferase involved in cell wall biosynthesis
MRKKILFVTHALESMYGASTSLRLLLDNYSDVEADLMLARSFRQPRDLGAIAASYPAVRRAYEISIPLDLELVGLQRDMAAKAHGLAHWLGWQRDKGHFRRLVRDNRYDIVHFNSTVLHRMLTPGIPAVTHVREIVRADPRLPVIAKMANGLGCVFIDSATRQPFARHEAAMHALTLNNPTDMRDVAQRIGALHHPRINGGTTVFSIIGQINAMKGVEMVIEAFRRGAGPSTLLLVVGGGTEAYIARCRASAGDDPRIVFWGEESDIKAVYAATDYVVRGEAQPCIGRTVYEGLYAGCRVILPGPMQPGSIFEAEQFGDAMAFYTAASRDALAATFDECSGKKVGTRVYRSNVSDYVRAFDGFLDSCLARQSA